MSARVAFLFPGQGSQHAGMGRALADRYLICRETFAEADAALGDAISRLCFEGPDEALALTENTQPAILVTSLAIYRLLDQLGHRPDFVAGHSLGEYSALVAAGALTLADAMPIVRRRGRYMQEAVPVGVGSMAAVLGLDQAALERVCEEAAEGEVVQPANLNGPEQIVIAGHAGAVARASARAKDAGAKRAVPLPVSAPFHCALMRPARERLEPELRALPVRDPRVPIATNVDGRLVRTGAEAIDALVRQVDSPVRWEACIRLLAAEGVTRFVEVGPGMVLTGLLRRIVPEAAAISIEDQAGLDKLAAV